MIMEKTWHLYWEQQPREGAANMAVDQHLLELIETGRLAQPILRIYAWTRPTLSLGYHQTVARAVRQTALEEYGVDLVRRWTGGRAVLHDHGEITYSVIAPIQAPFTARVAHNYQLIGEALGRFVDLGPAKGLLRAEAEDDPRGMKHAPCFASLSQSEIEARGRKLIGSAQKLGKQAFLQHGSIPLLHRADVLEAITGTTLKMERYMVDLRTHYLDAGQPLPDRKTLVKRLVDSFRDQFQIRFLALEETGFPDEQRVKHHIETRFGTETWTFRK